MQSVRYPCQILMKLEFSVQIFEKILILHENPSGGSRVVSWGTYIYIDIYKNTLYIYIYIYIYIYTKRQAERVMTKVIVAFRNFANSPKNTPTCIIPSEKY